MNIKKSDKLGFSNKSKLEDNKLFPKVSVITVVKNSQKHLEEAIKSVINQTYKNIEYIIVDGNSLDNTQNILKKYKKNINIYHRSSDKNLWDAMNKGIKLSSGSIICFFNSDDILNKNAAKYAVKYLKNKKIDFVFGTVFKHWLKSGFFPKKARWSFGFYTTHSVGFFCKKKVFDNLGYLNDNFLSADLDFFLRIIFSKKFIGSGTKKNEIFGYFRTGGGFSSKVKYRDHLKDLNKIRLNNNQNQIFVWLIYIFKIIKNLKKFILNKH